jgi:hypothetical protein
MKLFDHFDGRDDPVSRKEKRKSMPKLQLLCNRLVARQVGLVEIIQQTTALADHHQQSAAGTVVLDIFLQMLSEMINSLRQKGHLHVGGPCVLVVQLKARYRLSFFHIFDQINSFEGIM